MNRLGPFEENTIVIGDCVDIMAQMPDGCVDLILTDPPYPREYEHLYTVLAKQGSRILKVGGSLVTLCGHYQIPFVIQELGKFLRYWWIGGMIHKTIRRFPGKWVNVKGKPVLWYVKERRRPGDTECPIDFLQDSGKQKDLHDWQQNEFWFSHWVDRLCPKNGIVADFFMGSGTTAVVADRLGRKFFGCDINPDYVEMALERLKKDRENW